MDTKTAASAPHDYRALIIANGHEAPDAASPLSALLDALGPIPPLEMAKRLGKNIAFVAEKTARWLYEANGPSGETTAAQWRAVFPWWRLLHVVSYGLWCDEKAGKITDSDVFFRAVPDEAALGKFALAVRQAILPKGEAAYDSLPDDALWLLHVPLDDDPRGDGPSDDGHRLLEQAALLATERAGAIVRVS